MTYPVTCTFQYSFLLNDNNFQDSQSWDYCVMKILNTLRKGNRSVLFKVDPPNVLAKSIFGSLVFYLELFYSFYSLFDLFNAFYTGKFYILFNKIIFFYATWVKQRCTKCIGSSPRRKATHQAAIDRRSEKGNRKIGQPKQRSINDNKK